MATLKQKQDDFKNISGEMDINGAPIYANDFIRLQQNAKADFINKSEGIRAVLPVLDYDQGASPVAPNFANGLILAGLEYDNTDVENPVINEGYILSGGEVCYYPGGTIAAGVNPNPTLLYLKKGSATFQSRIFDDGGNKEILVTYGVDSDIAEIGTFGPEMPTMPILITEEVVVITIGSLSTQEQKYAENHFSMRAAMNTQEFGTRLTVNAFTDATSLGAGWTVDADGINKIGSRVNLDGTTQITGSVVKTFAGGTATEVPFTLNANNIAIGAGVMPFNVSFKEVSTSTYDQHTANISPAGVVNILPKPGSSWPTGDLIFYFNISLIGSSTAYNANYSYNRAFMDITP